MLCKQGVGLCNQLSVKMLLRLVVFVATDEHNCIPIWVEGKRYAESAVIKVGPQFLHVGKLRSVQRVGMRSTEIRAKFFEQVDLGLNFGSFLVA